MNKIIDQIMGTEESFRNNSSEEKGEIIVNE